MLCQICIILNILEIEDNQYDCYPFSLSDFFVLVTIFPQQFKKPFVLVNVFRTCKNSQWTGGLGKVDKKIQFQIAIK
jgi:hypothetical protein